MITETRTATLLSEPRRANRPDYLLMGAALALAAIGVVMVYTASAPRLEALGLNPASEMRRQVVFVVAGAVVFLVASVFPVPLLRRLTPAIYVLAVLLLIAVLSPLGDVRAGAQRWIPIGSFQLQPSEFAKPAIIVTLAALLHTVKEGRMRWVRIFRAMVLVAIPSILIFLQPDLGTMLVFGFVGVAMLFVAGTTMRQLITLVIAALLGTVMVLSLGVLKDYQLERLTGFLDQSANTATANYNQYQSQVTIGSGQLFGKGLFEGDQTNLSFVPAQATDFIFTALAEQMGFLGGGVVLALFAVIIWRLLMAAAGAPTQFGQLIAAGSAAMIGFHVFVNVGMTIGLMPVTGLPLPLMSAGGSALIAVAIVLGISHAVWLQRSPIPALRRAV
jgi:rod shape determining protein RodA